MSGSSKSKLLVNGETKGARSHGCYQCYRNAMPTSKLNHPLPIDHSLMKSKWSFWTSKKKTKAKETGTLKANGPGWSSALTTSRRLLRLYCITTPNPAVSQSWRLRKLVLLRITNFSTRLPSGCPLLGRTKSCTRHHLSSLEEQLTRGVRTSRVHPTNGDLGPWNHTVCGARVGSSVL